jgi:hypothetical protein
MATAKRIYLYTVSGVSQVLLLVSIIAMLRLLFRQVGIGPHAVASTYAQNSDRDFLALALAGAAVSLAVWLIHWALIERMVRADDESGAAERASIVRSVYFALSLYYLLSYALSMGIGLFTDSLSNLAGATTLYSLNAFDDAWSLSAVIVLGASWAYHAWIRARDVRMGPPIRGAAAWISRLYLYLVAASAVVTVVQDSGSIVSIVGANLAGITDTGLTTDLNSLLGGYQGSTAAWWVRPLVGALVGIVVYGVIWLGHWLYATRLRDGAGVQSALERTSRVRIAYFMLVIAAGAFAVAIALVSGLGSLFMWMLGVDPGTTPLWYLVIVPPLTALPALGAWWAHRYVAAAESPIAPHGISPLRVAGYLTALIGMAAVAIGAIAIVSAGITAVFAPTGTGAGPLDITSLVLGPSWTISVAIGLAALVVGLVLWLRPWFSAERRRLHHWADEVGSSARAWYLYAIAGTSVIAGGMALAFVLYHYIRLALGLAETGLASDVSMPIAIAAIAGLLLACHARVIVVDRRPPAYPPYAYPYPGMPGAFHYGAAAGPGWVPGDVVYPPEPAGPGAEYRGADPGTPPLPVAETAPVPVQSPVAAPPAEYGARADDSPSAQPPAAEPPVTPTAEPPVTP